jgi:hypothetical protein
MAPILLQDEEIRRRTLGHDMESFFAIIVWIASYDYTDEAVFLAKPLAMVMLDKKRDPMDITNAKENWFEHPRKFYRSIIDYFYPTYRKDEGFVDCLLNLREILYPVEKFDVKAYRRDKNDNKAKGDTDPMKENLFRKCMEEIDGYLLETKGCDEMQWIDSTVAARHR